MERGTVLAGRYVIQDLFRHDLCRTTYLAQDTGSDLLVVIQTVPEQINNDERLLADFKRNFLLLHAVDHPHIIKMLALEYDGRLRTHFLVQEYTVGVSLSEYRLSKPGKRLTMREALALCQQVADALDHAHRLLLHRHIHPDNIIITAEGNVKLWNFGLIPDVVLRELRLAVTWEYGQPEARLQRYMAPEQLAGLPSHSPASDRWALAVVFYELIFARLPFDASDPQALVQAICQEELKIPRGGRWYYRCFGGKQVFARAFSKEPAERFSSSAAFIHAMELAPFPCSLGMLRKITVTATAIMLFSFLTWFLAVFFPSFSPISPDNLPRTLTTSTIEQEVALTPDLKKTLLLRIESIPTGALVVLDGKRLGVTPFTVGRVAPGAYHLWLEKQGFKPVDIEIDLTQDTIVSMSLDLLSSGKSMGNDTFIHRTEPLQSGRNVQDGKDMLRKKLAQELNEKISHLLHAASADLKASRLTRPKGKNALEKYRAIQTMDPQNSEAQEGMRHIADQLIKLARKDIKLGRLSRPPGRNASERLQIALTLDSQNLEMGKSVANLVNRYVSLAARGKQTPAVLQKLLDQAVTVLPDDINVEGARQVLLSLQPETLEEEGAAEALLTAVTASETAENRHNLEKSSKHAPASSDKRLIFDKISTISQPKEKDLRIWNDPVSGLSFVWIDKGCFHMGSKQGDADEQPIHPVCLDGFWMGRHEVTQEAWRRVMVDEANPSRFKKGGKYPLDSISWDIAQQFVRRLNEKSSDRFRLPTEAEWEYGCRAGSQTPFHFGNSIHAGKANFNGAREFKDGLKGRYVSHPLPVGSFSANRFGLFDMHGNMYEWVEDRYKKDYYGVSPQNNPLPPATLDKTAGKKGNLRVLRGGAWYSNPRNLRCAYRYWGPSSRHNYGYGFRLLRMDSP